MKILVADDHALFREGLRHVLAQLAENVEVVEAGDCEQALRAADSHTDIVLVLLDLHMPGRDGFVALETLSRQHPTLPIVVLSASESRADMRRALDHGAMGFIPKAATSAVMLSALRLVMAGGIYVPPEMVQAPAKIAGIETSHVEATLGLTSRQLDVLGFVLEGKSNKVIAAELGLTEATVKAHITAVFKTLNVSNRTQAALLVERKGIKLTRKAT